MSSVKKYIIFLYLFLSVTYLRAQNITGTWEGDLGDDEFLQINIIQNGDKICGYTWDYVKPNHRSYCRAYFEGTFDKAKKKWLISGTSFIENSGGHILMYLNLKYKKTKEGEFLEEKVTLKGLLSSIIKGFNTIPGDIDIAKQRDSSMRYVYVKKISGQPSEILDRMKDCFNASVNAKDSITTDVKILVPENPADSIPISKQVIKRKNTEQNHIEVNVKEITLDVYDNAVVDGDTVSIFYNGKLLLSHQRLSEKPIVINLTLDENKTRHELTLFAENLGGIPPNTALIVVHAGSKRYELFSSASLEENAVLVFDYKPK